MTATGTIQLWVLTVLAILITTGLIILYIRQYRKLTRKLSETTIASISEKRDLLEQIIHNMPDYIYLKDRDSRFVIANKYLSKKMGFKDPAKMLGKTDFDFYEKELAQEFYDDEQRIMQEEKAMINKEERGLGLQGRWITVSTSKIPIRDKDNKVIGVIGIGRDISKQKEAEKKVAENAKILEEKNVILKQRLEEIEILSEELRAQEENLQMANIELERLSLVARKTANVVVIMDKDGEFEWANEGFEKKYKMNLETFKKVRGSNIRDNSSNPGISKILEQIAETGSAASYNAEFTDNNGRKPWSLTHITPVLDANNDIASLILIDSDITDLKSAETKIKQQSAELIKLNAMKDKLFSIIGHDLKNPLNSIIGFAELLNKNQSSLDDEQLEQYSKIIFNSSLSAQRLLDNLLTWARLQTGKIITDPSLINIKALFDEVVTLQQARTTAKNIELINKIGDNINAFADRNMINTVLRNILSNAIKFTENGGKVIFSATEDREYISIRIEDNGIGMDDETRKNLFQIDKMKSTKGTSGEEGTGLGLILCQEFVEKNHGKIDVESKPGKGSKFTIHLPSKEFPDLT